MNNNDFNIPYYIFEEIVEYIELVSKGNNKISKWRNIRNLLLLAQSNNHLTKDQVNFLIEKYNRE